MLVRLIQNLEAHGPLSAAAHAALQDLPLIHRVVGPDQEIVDENANSDSCHLLLRGMAIRHKTLSDGRRQILGFHVPGDALDPEAICFRLQYEISALTRCEVALVPRSKLAELTSAHASLACALWRLSLVQSAIEREWMVGIGRRTAYARIAHLLCETLERMRNAGLANGDRCAFPVTQAHLGDALGLSVVHTNRVLQALRGEGLISLRHGELHVLDYPRLVAAGEFDPAYLQLRPQAA